MRRFLLLLSGIVLFASVASAQVIDMRAYSRRRGFKPYTVKREQTQRVERQYVRPTPAQTGKNAQPAAASPQQKQPAAQSQDNGRIHQTGVKIFQEKDEDKVLKFDVDNPEFDKLTKRQQDDVMSRISIKEE